MIDKLISIPGPIFLIVFAIFAFIVIYLAWKYSKSDYTKNLELPEPTKLSPLNIAILRRGIKGAIITSIFNLWRIKAIDITQNKKNVFIKQKRHFEGELNKLERSIYNFSSQPRFYKHLYKKSALKKLENILKPNKTLLQELKLAPDIAIINRHWRAAFLGLVLLLVLGGTKLYFGVIREKPVAFLVLLLISSIIVLFSVIKPNRVKTSALGNRFLEVSDKRFEWLKKKESDKDLLKDDNLLYGIALFGISSFAGTGLGSVLENPILIESSANTIGHGCSGGGSCSGGCSSGCVGCGGCGG
jgi:uncharacterized protein (TIGR04222 family)